MLFISWELCNQSRCLQQSRKRPLWIRENLVHSIFCMCVWGRGAWQQSKYMALFSVYYTHMLHLFKSEYNYRICIHSVDNVRPFDAIQMANLHRWRSVWLTDARHFDWRNSQSTVSSPDRGSWKTRFEDALSGETWQICKRTFLTPNDWTGKPNERQAGETRGNEADARTAAVPRGFNECACPKFLITFPCDIICC